MNQTNLMDSAVERDASLQTALW